MSNKVGVENFELKVKKIFEIYENEHITSLGHSLSIKTYKKKGLDASSIAYKVIFFIHGVAGCSYIWHNQLEYFAHLDYFVVCFDLVGHGKSTKMLSNSDYTFDNLTKACLSLFDEFSAVNKTNVIVGHSYGCSMASVIAHDRPHLVSRLVLISGGSTGPLGPPDYLYHIPLCLMKCFLPMMMFIYRKKTFHRPTDSFSTERLSIGVDSFVLKATMLGQEWKEGNHNYHTEIIVPTLIIHGLKDSIVSYEEEWNMKYAIPNSTLHFIDNVGHFSMLEAPIQVNQLIRNHIDEDWDVVMLGLRPVRFYRVGCHQNTAIKRGLTLYREVPEPKLKMLSSFFHNESVVIPEEFEIVGPKTLPPSQILRRKSSIRRKKGNMMGFQVTTIGPIEEEESEVEV